MSHIECPQIPFHHELDDTAVSEHISTCDRKRPIDVTISISLLSRNTPYSKRYVSTPFENSGNLQGLLYVLDFLWTENIVLTISVPPLQKYHP